MTGERFWNFMFKFVCGYVWCSGWAPRNKTTNGIGAKRGNYNREMCYSENSNKEPGSNPILFLLCQGPSANPLMNFTLLSVGRLPVRAGVGPFLETCSTCFSCWCAAWTLQFLITSWWMWRKLLSLPTISLLFVCLYRPSIPENAPCWFQAIAFLQPKGDNCFHHIHQDGALLNPGLLMHWTSATWSQQWLLPPIISCE